MTWLAENGTPPHVADRLLNHVAGTIRGVAAVYQRGEFAEERRRALDAWAAHVLLCAEGKNGADHAPRADLRTGMALAGPETGNRSDRDATFRAWDQRHR